MPRFLVQTQSGSWYQLDEEACILLRNSSHGVIGIRPQKLDRWVDQEITKIEVGPKALHPMVFLFKQEHNGRVRDGVMTTSPVISFEIIENISKRRKLSDKEGRAV